MNQRVSLLDFPGTVREQLQAASAFCKSNPGTTLFIPAGRYLLEDERALEVMHAVLDGTYGENPQPVMFTPTYPYSRGLDLEGCRDITVEAQGALLLIHGFMEPVTIRDAENITVNGLCIDHLRKPFSRGTVIAGNRAEQYIDLKIDPSTPFDPKASAPRNWAFDTKTRTILPFFLGYGCFLEKRAADIYRYRCDCSDMLMGCDIYFTHTYHFRPAIMISHSTNTRLNDVTIRSMCGMGVVGFKSRDIFMNRLRVEPDNGYAMSTNTDATHFSCCSGVVSMENSTFCGQGDDAINIHSYYYSILKADGSERCTICVNTPDGTHAQEPDYPLAGFRLQLVERSTLRPVGDFVVMQSSETETCKIVLDRPLAADAAGEYLFSNITELPQLIFRNNYVRCHLARSVLCKTHHARIENNYFDGNSGTAVHIAAEGSWGEGIAAKDVVVRGNTFYHNGMSWHGTTNETAAVSLNMAAEDATGVGIHEDITIENNRVVMQPRCRYAFNICNAKNVTVRNNQVEGAKGAPVYTAFCENVSCDLACDKEEEMK